MSALDITAASTPTRARPFRPIGKVSTMNVVRIPLLLAASGKSTAEAMPSHVAASAMGSMNTTASNAPLRAVRASRAAKLRE